MAQLGLRRYLGVVEVVGSNPAAPILPYLRQIIFSKRVRIKLTKIIVAMGT